MSRHQFTVLIATCLAINSASVNGAENIGELKQLLIDDQIIDSKGGAERVFKQAIKSGPVLSASKAWETERSLAYPTVRRESPSSWKIWYRVVTPAGDRAICYATSRDGVSWIKPELGIYPHHGGRNNIVLIGQKAFVDTPSVFKVGDDYYMYCIEGDKRYVIYHSPDGIHDWERAIRGLHADHRRIVKSGTSAAASQNYDICLGVYDRWRQDYIFHFKVAEKQKLFGPNDWQRKFCQHRYSGHLGAIQETPFPLVHARHELADRIDEALEPGTLRAESYGLGMYPQEDGSVIGFSWLFSITGHNGLRSAGGDGTGDGFWHFGPLNVMLVYSRDINGPWQRPTRRPILPRGPSGAWDCGMVHTANAPVDVPRVETNGAATDQVWMYYGGANHLHNRNPPSGQREHQFGIAKWRSDGFAALEDTDSVEDTITTRPILFSGKRLVLNADVKAGGYIKVRVKSLQTGYYERNLSQPLTGNHQSHVVRWDGERDLSDLAGREVVLEFRVKDAALYSLRFSSDG